jgi:hypothetical protein
MGPGFLGGPAGPQDFRVNERMGVQLKFEQVGAGSSHDLQGVYREIERFASSNPAS